MAIDPIGRSVVEQRAEGLQLVAGLARSAGLEGAEAIALAEAALGSLWEPGLMLPESEALSDEAVSDRYESWVRARAGAKAARRALGIFYTPASAARELVVATGWSRRADPELRCADAACGTGSLLVAALALAPRSASVACYGFDTDPVAVVVARARLLLVCKALGRPTTGVAERIVCGDALAAASPCAEGMTLVVGNPPFGNAIERETSRDADETSRLRARFPEVAKGPFDRAVLFASLSLAWAAPGGEVALVLPRTMQSVGYAAPLRQLWEARAEVEVVPCSSKVRFAGASVAVSFWLARAVGERSGVARWVGSGAEWWTAWVDGWPKGWVPLRSLAHFQSGATVAEAYRFAGLLTEGGDGLAFVTAGAVEPHWFNRVEVQRYLGRDWADPRLPEAAAGRRATIYLRPKVCVAALSRVVEAATDERGEVAAAVSVLVGWPQEAGLPALRMLALLCNSALFRLRYQTANAPQAMAGGSVPVSKRRLGEVAVPPRWFEAPRRDASPADVLSLVLPTLPQKELVTASKLAALADAVRCAALPVAAWQAALWQAVVADRDGEPLGLLQPLADGCLMAHYLCDSAEE